jgi:hypothetical protein
MTAKEIMDIIDSLKDNIKDNDYLMLSNILKKMHEKEKLYVISIIHPVLDTMNTMTLKQSNFLTYLKKCNCYECNTGGKCRFKKLYDATGYLEEYDIRVLNLLKNDLKIYLKYMIVNNTKIRPQNVLLSSKIYDESLEILEFNSDTSSDEYDSE